MMKMNTRNYKYLALFLISLLFISFQVNAQMGFVKGKITSVDGKPLPGVTIAEKNTDNRIVSGAISNLNGEYQLNIVNRNDTLYFSFIGMHSQAKAIKNLDVMNITMSEEVLELSDAIVTAIAKRPTAQTGFLNINQRDQTASISTVSLAKVEEIPATSIDQILEGQVSGLMVSMNSGDPGSGSSIQIRGATSLGLGSRPLIVVDQVPHQTSATVDLNNPEGLSELVNISPSDIQSIDVLKDAAATALYGSDGANGVILITTKRGDAVKPRVNLTSTSTIRIPQKTLPLLNGDEYKTMILEGYEHTYGTNIDLTTSAIRNLFLEPGSLDYSNYNNNTSWPDQINMIRGFGQNYTGSVIGGGEATKYNISLGYNKDTGPSLGTDFSRLTGRFNFDYKVSDKLTVLTDISYSSQEKKSAYENLGSISTIKAPVLPIFTKDINGNPLSTFFFPGTNGFQNDVKNPLALVYNALNNTSGKRFDGSLSLRFAPIKRLQINSLASTTFEGLTSDKFLPHSATGYDLYRNNNSFLIENSQVNLASSSPLRSFSLYEKTDIIYNVNLGEKHTLQPAVFMIYQENSSNGITLAGTNTPQELLTQPYSTDIWNTIGSSSALQRKLSVLGQLYYLYDDRYSISASLRRQGDSAFGENNRWGTFPSVSGFWRPSSEAFMKDKYPWIDQLKIRGSWGITGRAPNVSAANAFTLTSNAPFFDIQGVTPDNIQLVNLRWEKSTQSNIGLDLGLFKGRLTMVVDRSNTMTRDLIMSVPLSPVSGFESYSLNFGSIRSKVWEGELTGVILKSAKWDLTTSFNISNIRNKVLDLPNHEPVLRDNVLDNGKFLTMINEGDPTGTFYGLKYLGVYPTNEDAYAKDENGELISDLTGNPIQMKWNNSDGYGFMGGDAKYADINHDGLINKQDVVAIGHATPDFFGGFMFRLKYNKGLELFASFVYQTGFDIANMTKMNTTNMYYNNNQSDAVLRRWRKQGDVTDIPRALYSAGYNWVGSDRYIEDGSYVKCNTLSLSYNLNRATLDKLKWRSAKVALTVYNAFILTKYSGVDPSISSASNDPFYFGRDESMTPNPITYSLAFWLNF